MMRCCPECGAIYRGEFDRCLSDGVEIQDTDRDPLIGKRIGQYKVDELLGEGGMGRVYRAHHALLSHKLCALKVLIGDYATTTTMRIRFAEEAKNASRLSHPNIAAVTDFGRTESGLLYIAMELVEGCSLGDLIDKAPLPVPRVISIARQLCEGLAHAHALGLIHRDFKPDNVLVDAERDIAKIVDFGLAIPNDQSGPRVTTTGLVMGTPLYIAPEQCTASELDHRADLYALGAALFEMLSGGRLPFEGEAAEIVGLKVATAAPALLTYAPDVPPGLASLVDRLLARKPENRPADAQAVLAALDEIVLRPDSMPTVAREGKRADTEIDRGPRTTTPTPELRTRTVRRPSSRLGIAIAGISLAVAVVVAAWILRPASAVEVVATTPPQPPAPKPEPAPPPVVVEPTMVHEPRDPSPRIERPAPQPKRSARRPTQSVVTLPSVAAPAPSPTPAPPTPVPAPPAPPTVPASPATSTAVAISSLTVDGALPQPMVRRALDRVMPAIRDCRAPVGVVTVTFAISESRRAIRTSATGSPAAARCVTSALGSLRTESAPDVGDTEVRVQLAFTVPG